MNDTASILFFDDEPLMVREKLVRRVVVPTRIATYQDPSGNVLYGYPGVFRDPESGAWRVVYQTVRVKGRFLLAESADGIDWHPRDTVEAIPLRERHARNQILPDDDGNLAGVYCDPEAAPEQRVKLLATRCGRVEGPHSCSLWMTHDGLRWTEAEGVRWQVHPSDPPSCPFYCEVRGSHVITSRPGFTDRRITVSETRDWRNFSPQELALQADALDDPMAQLYGMYVLPYAGIYVGILWVFRVSWRERRLWPHLILGKTDCQLAYSLNGWHWQRSLREPFLSNGEPGEPDSGLLQVSSAVPQVDGSLLFYASTSAHEHSRVVDGDGFVSIYQTRRDGFICLESGGSPGFLGTRALFWQGGEASLNASCPSGWSRARVTDAKGEPMPGYGFDECRAFSGDSTEWTPTWRSGRTMDELRGRMVRLEIEIENGRLYAIRGRFLLCRLHDVWELDKGVSPVYRAGF